MDKVLITGATGFLGRYIVRELGKTDQLFTLGRKKSEAGIHIFGDLKEGNFHLGEQEFDMVVHVAGKAHTVPKTEAEAQEFYQVNHQGTVALLEALSGQKYLPKSFVYISSIAVYGKETGNGLDEETPLRANEPYGHSKILAEEAVLAWGSAHTVKVAILRLPLIVGEDAPGNLGAMVSAVNKGYYFNIGAGKARRSMVFAEDVAKIITKSAKVGGVYNLTDGRHPSFKETAAIIASSLGKSKVPSIPVWLAKMLAINLSMVEKITGKKMPFSLRAYQKMTSSLTFSDQKARQCLAWKPAPALDFLEKI